MLFRSKPAKSQYRRFRIKTVEGPNDFESMREVVGRRFRRALQPQEQDSGDGFGHLPDLIIIDGGAIQLEFAQRAMHELGFHVPMMGLAKRNEEIVLPNSAQNIVLPKNSAELHLLQRIRDEAHRFAITYHRSLRQNHALRSRLDEIPGIGKKRRSALLREYPLPAQLEQATAEQLGAVPGMNKRSAQALWDALHSDQQTKDVQA